MVRATFSGDNILSKSYDLDLGLEVPNNPPIVQITDYEWLDEDNDDIVDTYVLSGQVSDPDGETVTLSITMNGGAAGTIEVNGATWTSSGIPFYQYQAGDYTIIIEACDSSELCTTIEKIVPNLYWAEDTGPTVDPTVITEPAGEESMPAPGIAITLAGIAVALFAF